MTEEEDVKVVLEISLICHPKYEIIAQLNKT